MNKASEAQKRYDEQNARRYQLKLNRKTDADIIERLDRVGSMQGYIRDLIRADIEKDKGIREFYQIIDATIEEQKEQPVNVEKKAEPPANGEKAYININEI